MKIAVVKEVRAAERRVAATPETIKKLKGLGFDLAVETGAGALSYISDADYEAAGALVGDRAAVLANADIVLKVQGPGADELAGLPRGAVLVASLNPYQNRDLMQAYASAGLTAMAMEFMPRITRAQSMDILSSQSNLAGYKAVLDACEHFGRALPMMMTAAGTIPAAKVFVMGAGVAGLQAIATAKRLGAIVSATDVRLAAKEQVESLGGKFVMVEDEETRQAETSGGYAKEMSDAYKAKQAALIADTIRKQDIIITTALIPGRPAPRLVTAEMVASMQPGSVIVDLAAEQGGNCELTQPGEVVTTPNGVTIVGHRNVPSRLAANASALFSRNLYNFLAAFHDKEAKTIAWNWDDEILRAIVVTKDGAVVHPALQG
ncbi:Re/Si-specific NAD(P)(+) transhydrogenase subunit alpha [Pedomonas mirosovicensis]|uniref:Re/Si-specific NAD(P)(+) transhydrogenase subunit alpha n=1 Tax=Pedomonas mirosovicensis TaxID=2908641 RepID=UPI002168008C|nr:Re/Si-specific NAD(P)(+) transhydrogenase subunit alpha [Pedomonas mirosovicensis]MCH8684728.1 Re/Si-specific NAD(P)(+) transhydrogenase subunit alpha [Pedomonas mirosovicensis]